MPTKLPSKRLSPKARRPKRSLRAARRPPTKKQLAAMLATEKRYLTRRLALDVTGHISTGLSLPVSAEMAESVAQAAVLIAKAVVAEMCDQDIGPTIDDI